MSRLYGGGVASVSGWCRRGLNEGAHAVTIDPVSCLTWYPVRYPEGRKGKRCTDKSLYLLAIRSGVAGDTS